MSYLQQKQNEDFLHAMYMATVILPSATPIYSAVL